MVDQLTKVEEGRRFIAHALGLLYVVRRNEDGVALSSLRNRALGTGAEPEIVGNLNAKGVFEKLNIGNVLFQRLLVAPFITIW